MLLRTASDIGAVLRNARAKRGWTQQQLADATGVSRAWVSMVENGKTSVEFELVVSAVHAMGLVVTVQSVEAVLPTESAPRTPLTRGGKPLTSRRVQHDGGTR